MTKKVATINDLSGMGRCSLTVAIPILSVLGVQACPLPTAILSNQTGYPHYYINDFTDSMPYFIKEWAELGFGFDGIYTGFLSDAVQVKVIENFLEIFKKKDTIFIVDPVMGDDGEIYPSISQEMVKSITQLSFKADIITPNLTECCILTGTDYAEVVQNAKKEDYLDIISEICSKLLTGSVKKCVVTGINYKGVNDDLDMIYNAVLENGEIRFIKSANTGGSYSGTGDILASVVCGMVVKGKGLYEAVELATKFISKAIADTYLCKIDRNDGVNFENYLGMLIEENNA